MKYQKEKLAKICIPLILIIFLLGSANNNFMQGDVQNFSADYSNAVRYHLKANFLDLDALDTYPQNIEKINTEEPYDLILLVQNRQYHNIDAVPYKKYTYDAEIAQYLEGTDKIQTDTELVAEIAQSFLSERASVQEIVGRALQWNKNNIVYDKALQRIVFYDLSKSRSAEDTLRLRRGTCVEYANTFIAFMRNLGIPARYTFGFYQLNDISTYHAWAEFYLKGYGWIPVETQSGRIGVPNAFIKLFVGRDISDIDFKIYQSNAHYEIMEQPNR